MNGTDTVIVLKKLNKTNPLLMDKFFKKNEIEDILNEISGDHNIVCDALHIYNEKCLFAMTGLT